MIFDTMQPNLDRYSSLDQISSNVKSKPIKIAWDLASTTSHSRHLKDELAAEREPLRTISKSKTDPQAFCRMINCCIRIYFSPSYTRFKPLSRSLNSSQRVWGVEWIKRCNQRINFHKNTVHASGLVGKHEAIPCLQFRPAQNNKMSKADFHCQMT